MSGRTLGMLFMTGFGTIWWLAGSAALGPRWQVAGLIVAVLLLVVTWRQAGPADAGPAPGVDAAAVQRRFNLVGLAEGVAIAVTVAACIAIGHPEWIAGIVCVIVGVHFLPLARIFAVPLYTLTGVALVVAGVATLTLVPLRDWPDAAWLAIPGIAAAIILWLTAAALPVMDSGRATGSG